MLEIQFFINWLFFVWLLMLTAIVFCHQRLLELLKEILELIEKRRKEEGY